MERKNFYILCGNYGLISLNAKRPSVLYAASLDVTNYRKIRKFQQRMNIYPMRDIEVKLIDSLGCRLYTLHK
jgi:hypothetical protein